jgi:SAM-dependent methyltransferase
MLRALVRHDRSMSTDAELLTAWRYAWAHEPRGWDFSDLAGRMSEASPPWSYPAMARDLLRGARSALDLGTGGGETLLALSDALPPDVVATEGWEPNVPVATAALAPHGIAVVRYDAEADPTLPFPDDRFDVVLSRHEAYDAGEVARVLRPGGAFLTQQVDGRDVDELRDLLDEPVRYPHVRLDRFREDAERAGLAVTDAREWAGDLAFDDVTTLLTYLRRVPWDVPDDFDVDRYRTALEALHGREQITFTQRRFVLCCRAVG